MPLMRERGKQSMDKETNSLTEQFKAKENELIRQYTLKIYPDGRSREVFRTIEICGVRTLRELCWVILDAFDFDHDHLYEFCMDNRMYGRHAYRACPRYDEPSVDITLDELALHKGQKFSLHYDFGDDWMFTITVFKISEVKEPIESRIIKTKGCIEQY